MKSLRVFMLNQFTLLQENITLLYEVTPAEFGKKSHLTFPRVKFRSRHK